MRVFVWKNVSGLTASWHDNGGLMIVAESLEDARALLAEEAGVRLEGPEEYPRCEAFDAEPDYAIGCDERATPFVETFPNAGCC